MACPDDVECAVCVYLTHQNREGKTLVLLGRKQRGRVAGWLVGPGGRVEDDESDLEAAVRELKEEIGCVVDEESLTLIGCLIVLFTGGTVLPTRVAVYRLHCTDPFVPQSNGELVDLGWYEVDSLPVDSLPPTDRFWLQETLQSGGQFKRWRFQMTPDYQSASLIR